MLRRLIDEHINVFRNLKELEAELKQAADSLSNCLRAKRKILICGNGGSAADAQHFAAELVGRFQAERKAYPAMALTTDSSILTALANDYRFARIFERQVDALGKAGDVLIGISTSGNSENVSRAVIKAGQIGLTTIGLLGAKGGTIAAQVDRPVVVPHSLTARIQEAHIFILHYWAQSLEEELGNVPDMKIGQGGKGERF